MTLECKWSIEEFEVQAIFIADTLRHAWQHMQSVTQCASVYQRLHACLVAVEPKTTVNALTVSTD